MTLPVIKIFGVPEALRAFTELPKRVRVKHMRIALNAGGGIIRNMARPLAAKDTGLLRKSLGVKVKIPDASYDARHHGKPAYAVIGPKRRAGKFLKRSASGALRGFGAAMKELRAARLAAAGNPLTRERTAVSTVRQKLPKAIYRNPSRYAHLVEKGTKLSKAKPFLSRAVALVGSVAQAKVVSKLKEGLESEALALSR